MSRPSTASWPLRKRLVSPCVVTAGPAAGPARAGESPARAGLAAEISSSVLISLPPSRALGLGPRLVVPEARQAAEREAGPQRRDTATAPGGASCRRRARKHCAAFGPAPAALPARSTPTARVSLHLGGGRVQDRRGYRADQDVPGRGDQHGYQGGVQQPAAAPRAVHRVGRAQQRAEHRGPAYRATAT